MSKYLKYNILLLIIVFASELKAQVEDAGLWAGIAIEKKINPALSVQLTEEIRLKENMSQSGVILSEIGATYKLNSHWTIATAYRYSNQRQLDLSYNHRHRYQIDLKYRYKYKLYIFDLRTRYQSQYESIFSSEDGKIPKNYWRERLSIKFDFETKIRPLVFAESFVQINAYDSYLLTQYRLGLGFEYKINRQHQIDLSWFKQQEINVNKPQTDYIWAVGYQFSF